MTDNRPPDSTGDGPNPPEPNRLDTELQARLQSQFDALNAANELRISRYAVLVVAAAGLAGAWFGFSLDTRLGITLTSLAVVFGAYHLAVVQPLLRRGGRVGPVRWINVTLEVSVTKAISLIDVILIGGPYALTSTPPVLTFMAIIASALRFSPRLAIYAGALAAGEHLAVYALARSGMDPAWVERLPSLGADYALSHTVYLLLAGGMAALVARVGRQVSTRAATEVLARERLGDLFGAYVSPQALAKLEAGELALGGERRVASVLFADIRSFTPLAFERKPEEVVDYLNAYFAGVCAAVEAHGGMVNKFMGDGLLAVFGAPEDDPDHARHAAAAALDMVEAAARVPRPDGGPTRIGVGLHTGEVLVGSIGGQHRRDYTVIGDAVNLAARIEGLTRTLDADVLLSADLLAEAGAGHLDAEDLGAHAVKGREGKVDVHRLVGLGPD